MPKKEILVNLRVILNDTDAVNNIYELGSASAGHLQDSRA